MIAKLFLWLISVYQNKISKHTPPKCRYMPTCSSYAKESILKHGALRGGILAFLRFMRCNPLFKGGIDNVPEHFSDIFYKRK